jgi:hypothetical protein
MIARMAIVVNALPNQIHLSSCQKEEVNLNQKKKLRRCYSTVWSFFFISFLPVEVPVAG